MYMFYGFQDISSIRDF